MKKESWFDENIDPECVPLIVALNQLPGIETVESCCGHLKDTFDIWFKCNNFTSLAIITRTFDRRYSDGKWELKLDTSDTEHPPYKTFCVRLCSKKPFKTWNEMFTSVNNAVGSLYYWSDERFLDHFNGLAEEREDRKREEKRQDCITFTERVKEHLTGDEEYILAKIKYLYGYRTYDIMKIVEGKEIEEDIVEETILDESKPL